MFKILNRYGVCPSASSVESSRVPRSDSLFLSLSWFYDYILGIIYIYIYIYKHYISSAPNLFEINLIRYSTSLFLFAVF
jgi:hypothetical protein